MARQRRTATTKKSPTHRAGSWLTLLAATTLGLEGAKTVHAEVKTDADLTESREYRLVVQSYDAHGATLPGFRARPIGSLQRSVTAAELRQGVRVNLLELRQSAVEQNEGAVVAWIEAGKPDLEFDGRAARPLPGSIYGLARRSSGGSSVQIRLTRKSAA